MRSFVIGDVHGRRKQLRALLEILPRDAHADRLILLGDLIDRGEDSPGVIADLIALRGGADQVHVLRGNHEQMMLDFLDGLSSDWRRAGVGSERTFEQYTGKALTPEIPDDKARGMLREAVPAEHVDFLRSLPFYFEDDFAIYVHAGLERNKHPRETPPQHLLWTRDAEFFKHYRGKTCVFGHTPTPLLPLIGRLGTHGIYIFHSAIGIDTAYNEASPLSCLSLPDFNLYQVKADGCSETHHLYQSFAEALRSIWNDFGA
ncbi:metallophosphoesterase family protein [Pyrinomonas methylaliphatogenes]|jgi:serine/threonine protein phosphatase 1|uniref:Calcineurin-like phosphoesterase n=1 Tax=Pyrinomonas methylaliphatogenes TaxID=454194 RepID=A0A0B6WUK3_9BACT|nr:metallophosphoesterase family protein [Pyrinomonas methylaliphatogenes]MBX5478847.1 serine/threonine protein phosphatase [Pyrinomonas methylaliphatogenes]CDM64681.1 Calcineurin-like phosphoesterase [Pyrinomonas methylaliphatogenes]